MYSFLRGEQGNSQVPDEQKWRGKIIRKCKEYTKLESQGFSNWDDRKPEHLLPSPVGKG